MNKYIYDSKNLQCWEDIRQVLHKYYIIITSIFFIFSFDFWQEISCADFADKLKAERVGIDERLKKGS